MLQEPGIVHKRRVISHINSYWLIDGLFYETQTSSPLIDRQTNTEVNRWNIAQWRKVKGQKKENSSFSQHV